MKKRPLARPSIFAQAVLASTVFCALPFTASAFADLDAAANGENSANPAYPPAAGYNFVDPNVSFTLVNDDIVGNTGDIAVDNNNGNAGGVCAGGACAGTEMLFQGNATVNGDVGTTNAINAMKLLGINNTVSFNTVNNIFKVNTLEFSAPGAGNTAIFNNGAVITGAIDNSSGNTAFLVFQGGGSVSGNIGDSGAITLMTVNENGNTSEQFSLFGQDIHVTNLFINDDASGIPAKGTILTLDNALMNFTGNITTKTNNMNTLDVLNASSLTGDIGTKTEAFHLIQVAQNVNTTVTGNLFATTTELQGDHHFILGNNTTITGLVDTKASNTGTLVFLGSGSINGDTGSINFLKGVEMQGAAGIADFQGTLDAGTFNFTNAADNATTGKFQDTVDLVTVDNLTGVDGNGNLLFLADGLITGTVGATHKLNNLSFEGAGKTVAFEGDINTNNLIFSGTADATTTASLADGLILNGGADNTSPNPNIGILQFEGSGQVLGNIGETSPIHQLLINSDAKANALVTLFGGTVNANTIHVNDDGATETTLRLSNTSVTGNLTAKTHNLNLIDIINPASINGNIGTLNEQFALIKIGANTTLNGNIFATNTQFQANQTLTIADNSVINTPITTLNNSQGQLIFNGNADIIQPIGAAGASLNTVQVNGALGTTVNLNQTIYASHTNINQGGTFHIVGNQTINGNLLINDGNLSLSDNTTPLQVNGVFQLNNTSILTVDLGGNLTAGYIQATGPANISPNSSMHIDNAPAIVPHGETVIPIILGGNNSTLNVIAVTANNLLLKLTTEVDNINHQLNLVVNAISPVPFATQSNTFGIAEALGSLINFNMNGTLGAILDALGTFTSIEQLNKALAQLAPTVDNSVIAQGFYTQLQTYHHVSGRMNESFITRILRQTDKEQGIAMGDTSSCYPHRGVWLDIFGHYGDQKVRQQIDGYRDHTAGVMLGADLVVEPNLLAGFAMSYADADIRNLVSPNAHTDVDNYQAMLYGQFLFDYPLYVNGYVSYGYNRYQATRYVSFGDLGLAPQADFHAWQYGAKAEVGYGFENCIFYIIPNASLYYARLALTEYVENGVGNANQQVNSQDYNILQSSVGVKVQTDMAHGNTMIQPEMHLQVFYNIINDNMQITSQFTGAGPNFVTRGATQPKGSFNLGASITAFDNEQTGVVATFRYDYLAQNNYHSHSGSFNIRYEW